MIKITVLSFIHAILLLGSTDAEVACPSGQCWTGENGCEVSEPGVVCIECVDPERGFGWVNGTSGCVYETFVIQTLDRVIPVSNCGLRKCNQGGTCVASSEGVRCEECSGRGYIVPSGEDLQATCVCYDKKYDPRAGCKSLYDESIEHEEITDAYESVICDAWQDKWMGFYKKITQLFKYGEENPPTPNQCLPSYGPPPNSIAEDLPPYVACATLGGPDPNEAFGERKDFSFQVCSGHGEWSLAEHKCVSCETGWDRALTGGLDVYGGAVSTCETCAYGYGPLPPNHDPLGTPKPPPYCVAPYLEDVDGVRKECSGHGKFEYGICICDSNPTDGYWNLTTIEGLQTCAVCADGYGPAWDCTVHDGTTKSPTALSTDPTPQPTVPPFRTSSCTSCFDRFQGPGRLVGNPDEFATLPSNLTTLCKNCTVVVSEDRTSAEVSGAECTNTTVALASLGYELCDYVLGCTAFDWVASNASYVFRFVNVSSSFPRWVEDSSYVWSLACYSTHRPTQRPTAYPTSYPTMAPTRVPTTRTPTRSPTPPTTPAPTTVRPSASPTTRSPTTLGPTTLAPSTLEPTLKPTTGRPTKGPSRVPTMWPTRGPTLVPTTSAPTTSAPTLDPTTSAPTPDPTTLVPTTPLPTTTRPSAAPTTRGPTQEPTTPVVGLSEGASVGARVGERVGDSEGDSVGARVGERVGDSEGELVERTTGLSVGAGVGAEVGPSVGADVGPSVGADVGTNVGACVGPAVGSAVGDSVGADVGDSVRGTEFA